MNTRINAIPTIEQAIRTLQAFGYDLTAVQAQHAAWIVELDERKPTDHDAKFATRADAPTPIEMHFIQETTKPVFAPEDLDKPNHERVPVGWLKKREYAPEILSSANAFKDRHFSLTPGQRDVLRNRYGLTPAATVILTDVALFPGTNIIWSINMRSAEHIDPRRRKHVLNAAVIAPAAKFFEDALTRDKEREAEQAEADAKRVKKGGVAISVIGRARAYME